MNISVTVPGLAARRRIRDLKARLGDAERARRAAPFHVKPDVREARRAEKTRLDDAARHLNQAVNSARQAGWCL